VRRYQLSVLSYSESSNCVIHTINETIELNLFLGARKMAQKKDDVFNSDEKNTIRTGSDIPGGDGTVSDEDMNAISDDSRRKKTGQDHSTENREDMTPTSGVGAIQSSSDTTSDVAHLADDEE